MWKDSVIKIANKLNIVKSINENTEEYLTIHTIHNDCEANGFKVKPYRKDKSLFTVEFFKYHTPKRTIKELTEKELLCVIKMYCIPSVTKE